MIRKQKPYMYYVLNIVLYLGVLIVYIVSHRVVANLEVMLIESKVVLAVRDFLNIARMLQTISIFFYIVRATGFDIKKFDFVRDLQSLDISEEDSEEYELAVEFEKNIFIRNVKKNLRVAKYYYNENKFIINIILLLCTGIIFLLIYLNIDKYNRVYSQSEYVNINSMQLGVTNSYVVNKDYKNDSIVGNDAIVAVVLSAKSSDSQVLPFGKLVLSVNNKDYYHIKDYNNSLIDLGTVYNGQKLNSEFSEYLLVYKIPSDDINKKMVFKYVDRVENEGLKAKVKSVDIKLNPINVDDNELIEKKFKLLEEADTTGFLSTYKVTINNFEIAKSFTNIYNFCVSNVECFDSREILVPSVTRNREKVLLKLNGNLSYDKVINNITDLYGFISTFGSIEYIYNGLSMVEKADFNQVVPVKAKDDNYYIEVDKDVMSADVIKLVFTIRNTRYVYVLKGDTSE